MDVDVVLYQYLILRNFSRVMQSPALILYALETFKNINPQPNLDTTNPLNTLNIIQTQFKEGKISVIQGREDSEWNCDESWKKYFLEAIYFTVTGWINISLSKAIQNDKQLTEDEEFQKLLELNDFQNKFDELKKTKFKSMLLAELDKNPEYKNFEIKNNSGKTYDDEVKAFELGYFELNLLEKIYILILKIMNWLASFRDKTFKCHM